MAELGRRLAAFAGEPHETVFSAFVYRCPKVRRCSDPRNLLLPARRYASAGLCDSNVSVCPSVRPSRAGIVSKRRKL